MARSAADQARNRKSRRPFSADIAPIPWRSGHPEYQEIQETETDRGQKPAFIEDLSTPVQI
jgi:hypothetical protein